MTWQLDKLNSPLFDTLQSHNVARELDGAEVDSLKNNVLELLRQVVKARSQTNINKILKRAHAL